MAQWVLDYPADSTGAGFPFDRPYLDLYDLTDAEIIDALEFNLQFHYALGVEPGTAHVCQKTLHNHRVRLLESDRAQKVFEAVTRGLAEVDGLSLGRQRLDSTHVISNIAVLTRLGLFVETVTHFMRALQRELPDRTARLERSYVARYLEREGYFADAKRNQARRRIRAVASDIYRLVVAFEGDAEVVALPSFSLLQRLFEEQLEAEELPLIRLREGKEGAARRLGWREITRRVQSPTVRSGRCRLVLHGFDAVGG